MSATDTVMPAGLLGSVTHMPAATWKTSQTSRFRQSSLHDLLLRLFGLLSSMPSICLQLSSGTSEQHVTHVPSAT